VVWEFLTGCPAQIKNLTITPRIGKTNCREREGE
jgi:hypothetical protein